jgi:renal tumor antigen
MDQYRLDREKGNGTFSVVFEAQSIKTGQRVAIKCMKKKFESVDKVRRLKEIQALTVFSHHENIVRLIEVLFDEPTGII